MIPFSLDNADIVAVNGAIYTWLLSVLMSHVTLKNSNEHHFVTDKNLSPPLSTFSLPSTPSRSA